MAHSSGTTSTAAAAATTSSNNGTISGSGKLRQFVCIEYPGLVENVDNMISTLGGIEKISEVSESTFPVASHSLHGCRCSEILHCNDALRECVCEW